MKKAKKQPTSNHHIRPYGWKHDSPDKRDLHYKPKDETLKKLPKKVDLRAGCPKVYDQGSLSSCTANAIAAAIEFELLKQNKKYDFMPSRLFIYYNERVIEKSVNVDEGAEIRNGIKSVNKQGVCRESMWKYEINKTRFKTKPSAACYKEALDHKSISYHRVDKKLKLMKACLAEGYPFVFGFLVYTKFEELKIWKSGVLNMPGPKEKLKGAHAVLCVGYDDDTKTVLVRNSWGKSWGQKGYFTMPYQYLTKGKLSDDFWTIRWMELSSK
ncbi:MAG: C1 family peptidase [Chryseobacterium sp.]